MSFISRLIWTAVVLCGSAFADDRLMHLGAVTVTVAEPEDPPPRPAAETNAALRAMLAEVLSSHTDIQAARAALAAADAVRDGAAQPLFNPELEVATERTDISTHTVGFSQMLDWHDKGAARARVAEWEHRAAREDARVVEYDTAATVLLALARFHSARDIAMLRAEQAQLLQRGADVADQSFSAGDIGQAETDFVHLGAEQASNQAVEAQAALEEALAVLRVATQSQRDDWPTLPQVIAADELPEPSELMVSERPETSSTPFTMLDTLPRVAVARLRAEVSAAKVRVAAKERRADPTFGLTLGREGEENLVGVSISIPLHVRNTFAAEERRVHAETTGMQAELERARKVARIEWLQASSRFQIAVSAWQRWHKQTPRPINERLLTLERLWRGGDLRASDYLLQAGEYMDAQVTAIDIRGRAWEAWFQWLAASGKLAQWLP